ncbi:hypothetical protein A4X13_0g8277 [Tilletia indica]|uniref:Uncharacterized protein n=1 Tax=Tilletia indica TaxID=43049 RepID=A0A177TBT6_9BASI|nr:hypothetical protein A4X13_0g8277 [Tilletia indica]
MRLRWRAPTTIAAGSPMALGDFPMSRGNYKIPSKAMAHTSGRCTIECTATSRRFNNDSEKSSQLRLDVAQREERVYREMENMIVRVRKGCDAAEQHALNNMQSVLDNAKTCNTTLKRDVRNTQSIWNRLQSQLNTFNAWTIAWPEAMRVGQSTSAPPPGYDPQPMSTLSRLAAMQLHPSAINATASPAPQGSV